jgi:hypothetical protein
VKPNYDSTKYADKQVHGPQPGTKDFGDQARQRRARLQEDAINATRPRPTDLGTGTAARSAGKTESRRARDARILREAGE